MGVLFESTGCCKCLAAFRTGVTASSDMRCPDVSLEIAGVSEHLVTVFTRESSELTVHHLVSEQIGSPSETFVAMLTQIFVRLISVVVNHVFVKSKSEKRN